MKSRKSRFPLCAYLEVPAFVECLERDQLGSGAGFLLSAAETVAQKSEVFNIFMWQATRISITFPNSQCRSSDRYVGQLSSPDGRLAMMSHKEGKQQSEEPYYGTMSPSSSSCALAPIRILQILRELRPRYLLGSYFKEYCIWAIQGKVKQKSSDSFDSAVN